MTDSVTAAAGDAENDRFIPSITEYPRLGRNADERTATRTEQRLVATETAARSIISLPEYMILPTGMIE
jgi:hypothetical protein